MQKFPLNLIIFFLQTFVLSYVSKKLFCKRDRLTEKILF